MNYVNLGKTGLKVSSLCLGCMTYGDAARGRHTWTLDEKPSRELIKQALDAGINFLDTANSYSAGTSEEFVGRAIKDFARREDVVLATKVYFPWGDAPNSGGLSRKAIFQAADDSLRRLGTDYIDLYQVHRWDYSTPIEETLEALHDLVRAGKVRYLGASSMYAWQFAKALYTADLNGWTRFVSMQNHVNLLSREEEREMLPLCRSEGIGVLPWSPLARGRLTRDWTQSSERSDTDEISKMLYSENDLADRAIIEAVAQVASERGVPRAQIALAWVLSKSEVTAPIVGASKPGHLADALAALDIKLTPHEIERLEAPYRPRAIIGQ